MQTPHPLFPRLFSPIRIRNMEMKNRIAISGHHAGWWIDGGLPSDEFVAYVEERCKGGIGLFVIGATSPKPGSGWIENLDDRIIPRYRLLADAGHRHGVPIVAQLCHPGFRPLPGAPLVGPVPSAPAIQPEYRGPERHIPPVEELHELVEAFGAAAGRAARGGVDGVELHSHEWFLHAEMLNPMWNTRTDEYGGSLENRMRFMVKTLRAMRKAIGPDLAVGVRLKADDMEQRGMGPEEYQECVRRLEAMQLVDYIIFTGGDARLHHGPSPRPEGEWIPLVRRLKTATSIPVMHAGRICTPEMAEEALREGALDVVVMTKTHIADPHFARKVFEGRMDDIRYCTRCLQACHGKMDRMTCVYNPLTSREYEWSELPPAQQKKRVVVIGAGPAGMEAALTAALRGHEVIVLESSARVGGQVWTAAVAGMRRPWARIAEFYQRQSARGLFETRLNTTATTGLVASQRPDVVIVATGSVPQRAEFPGGRRALTVHEVVAGAADGARSAVVLDAESFNKAVVAADYLSERGTLVHFVTPSLRVGPGIEGWLLDEYLRRLQERGVRFYPGKAVVEWNGTVRLRDVQTGEESLLEGVDALVGLVGATPVDDLAASLRNLVLQVHVIGDANFPAGVEQATYQGARLGRLL